MADHPIAAEPKGRGPANGGASVTVHEIAIVAFFGPGDEPVAANGLASFAALRTCFCSRRLTLFHAATVHDAIAAELEDAARRATVIIRQIAVVALLGRGSITITANRRPECAVSATKRRVGWLALLDIGVVDDAIATHLERATRPAPITSGEIAIVTFFACVDFTVAATRRHFDRAGRGAPVPVDEITIVAFLGTCCEPVATKQSPKRATIGARGGAGRLAILRASVIDGPVPAELERASVRAAVAVGGISIVALLGRRLVPISAGGCAETAVAIAECRVRRLAIFCASVVDDSIAA